MRGEVVGGWEYVWLAYGITLLVLGVYGLSVYIRYRLERARREREANLGRSA